MDNKELFHQSTNDELIESQIYNEEPQLDEFSDIINKIMSGEKHLSYSALSAMLKSPKHFKSYKMEKITTPAMEEGKMFHMAALERDKFESKYWVLNDEQICTKIGGAKPRSTKLYKEWVAAEKLKHSDKEMISKDNYDMFIGMSNALEFNSATKHLMYGLTEKEKMYKTELFGFNFLMFLDGKGKDKDGDYILDLKKVADASYEKQRWDLFKRNLDMQGALYSHTTKCKRYYIIYIDKGCNITVVRLSPETLEQGLVKLSEATDKFREAAETDAWNKSYEFNNGGYILV